MSESDYYYKSALNNIDRSRILFINIRSELKELNFIYVIKFIIEVTRLIETIKGYTNCMNDIHSNEIWTKIKEIDSEFNKILEYSYKHYKIVET